MRTPFTNRQAAVLAAVERLGQPTRLELRAEMSALAPSAIARVLDALERRGLVDGAGDEALIYLGDVRFWSTALRPTRIDVDLARLRDRLSGPHRPRDVSRSSGERVGRSSYVEHLVDSLHRHR